MARIESVETWDSPTTLESARAAVLEYLDRLQVKIEDRIGEPITGRQGSQLKTRFLGGWFVNPINFPKIVSVSLTGAGSGVRVEARIEENLGFGYLDKHFKSRYAKYFNQFMAGLRDAVPPIGY